MEVLVVGDVHGCYYTLKKLLKKNFNPSGQTLIQLGDLINKGPHSAKCIKYWFKLEVKYPGKVFFLRGNHEQAFIDSYLNDTLKKTHPKLLANLAQAQLNPEILYGWLLTKALSWENDDLLVSHAGISSFSPDPFNLSAEHNLLVNRKPLKPLSKTQVVGHQVLKESKPIFRVKENAWYIDTGAYLGQTLTGLLFNQGRARLVRESTSLKDYEQRT